MSRFNLKKRPSLIPIFNKVLEEKAKPQYKSSDEPKLKPSDFGNPCFRYLFYSYLRTEKDFYPSSKEQKTFDVGTALHEMMQSWLQSSDSFIPYLDPQTNKIPISPMTGLPDPEFKIVFPPLEVKVGKIDGVVIIDNQLWLVELKSIKDELFIALNEPKDAHQIQANIYVMGFEDNRKKGLYNHIPQLSGLGPVQGVIYNYFNKNTGDIKDYVVLVSETAIKTIFDKYKKFKKYVENKELPPKTKYYCNSCAFRVKCKNEINPLRCKNE